MTPWTAKGATAKDPDWCPVCHADEGDKVCDRCTGKINAAAINAAVAAERARCIRLCEMTEASDELHSMDWREAARTCRELIAGEEET